MIIGTEFYVIYIIGEGQSLIDFDTCSRAAFARAEKFHKMRLGAPKLYSENDARGVVHIISAKVVEVFGEWRGLVDE